MYDFPKPVVASRDYGSTYEATYMGWVGLLEMLAKYPAFLPVEGPASWAPFVEYMGHTMSRKHQWFPEDAIQWPCIVHTKDDFARRIVEISSACRPELVHALYEWDTKWSHSEEARARLSKRMDGITPTHTMPNNYMRVVTCNASFFRPEFVSYRSAIDHHGPFDRPFGREELVILVPCAADKPYPAPLHCDVINAVRDAGLDSPRLAVVTGVLGIVPDSDWCKVPSYDSGLPNQWNVFHAVRKFFGTYIHNPKRLVVYSDFYQDAIRYALGSIGMPAIYPFEHHEDMGYLDLRSPENLQKLVNSIPR